MKQNYIHDFVQFVAISFTIFAFGGSGLQAQDAVPPYKDSKLPVTERVADLLNRMTLEEKIDMLAGTGFATKPNARLGIPELKMTDGPLGVRWGKSTAFPGGTCLAATWDTVLADKMGKAIGEEVRGKGRDVILGPCVNIARIPIGGRTFEAFGEDPYLASRMAVGYIEGVQSEGVAATVKHFAANNQEYERGFVDEKIDHRTLNEIYFPAFKAAVEEARVLCVMSAYNKINGEYCSENDYLLKTKLKDDWKFDGLVMSDWGAVHSSIPTAKGGLDLEMPTGQYLNEKTLLDSVKAGVVKESMINDKVTRILRVMFELGLFDSTRIADSTLVNSPEHKQVAYQGAVEGIVLLKNEKGILPLNLEKIKSIAVIGPDANEAITGGGGSAHVTPVYSISPLEALQNKIGGKVKINFAEGVELSGQITPIDSQYFYLPGKNVHGIEAEYFSNKDLKGQPKVTRVDKEINFNWNGQPPLEGIPGENFSVRWMTRFVPASTGDYTLDLASDDGARLYINGKVVISDWTNHAFLTHSYDMHLVKGKSYKMRLEYYQATGGSSVQLGIRGTGKKLVEEAINAAKKSDVTILFVGTSSQIETEGNDRESLALPDNQDALIEKVIKANKNTIVVLITGAPVTMNGWASKTKGILEAWFGGDEAGNAIADVLLGRNDPSGRLPVTFPVSWKECSAYSSYNGPNSGTPKQKRDSVTTYSDGIFVGYRWFDNRNITPLFPFGYGLSYTKFAYSDLTVTPATGEDGAFDVSFSVENTGKLAGVEIPQLYIHDPSKSIVVPVKELKRFDRLRLRPGQSTTVKFVLKKSDFAHYNGDEETWTTHPGKYDILVGSSSRDIKLHGTLQIN